MIYHQPRSTLFPSVKLGGRTIAENTAVIKTFVLNTCRHFIIYPEPQLKKLWLNNNHIIEVNYTARLIMAYCFYSDWIIS